MNYGLAEIETNIFQNEFWSDVFILSFKQFSTVKQILKATKLRFAGAKHFGCFSDLQREPSVGTVCKVIALLKKWFTTQVFLHF